ncbi:hypothetical protein GR212_15565 [Rhizobium lusitanum]|uniref:DUF1640 domain-containing protein n=1 Tax=Rhizobium lusitanum TaxID=293958 RepID=A0A6L9U9N1_9HYPH|nr:hypothetical protein [Rhizobium lusitanum]NEI70996.1 hypothetical protein [Rhizobium lusitanum]
MASAFDTLGYAKRLETAGISRKHAEAHAEAAKDFIMPELATKADIAELKHIIERQSLALTVRLGGLIIIGVGALATLIKLS